MATSYGTDSARCGAGLAVGSVIDGKAAFLEALDEEGGDGEVVFDDQHAHGGVDGASVLWVRRVLLVLGWCWFYGSTVPRVRVQGPGRRAAMLLAAQEKVGHGQGQEAKRYRGFAACGRRRSAVSIRRCSPAAPPARAPYSPRFWATRRSPARFIVAPICDGLGVSVQTHPSAYSRRASNGSRGTLSAKRSVS